MTGVLYFVSILLSKLHTSSLLLPILTPATCMFKFLVPNGQVTDICMRLTEYKATLTSGM